MAVLFCLLQRHFLIRSKYLQDSYILKTLRVNKTAIFPYSHVSTSICGNSHNFRTALPSKTDLLSSEFKNLTLSHVCTKNISSQEIMNVFDRNAKRLQKERVAFGYNGEKAEVYDYVKDEFGYRTADRICDVKRQFDVVLDLGCGRGHVSKNIYSENAKSLIQTDLSHSVVMNAAVSPEVPTTKLVVDEEFLPFPNSSLDLVVSCLSLHWVNDLPGCFKQILNALKNDGVVIGCLFGADTLYELRCSLQLAEIEREGGFAPHVSPFTTVNDLGNLLNRAGFTMLTLDTDQMIVNYPSMFELMHDLKGMAENSCAWARKPHLHRDTMLAASAIYKEMYGHENGLVPATFNVINFIAWKPDPSQPKPAARGSQQFSLKDIDKIDELAKQQTKYKRPELASAVTDETKKK